ncbi:hypothetical protein J6590_052712 [Homalodisca vitripennis]|nr:hypothetical protein J6590_052712 [Homalodisca vitripennis]
MQLSTITEGTLESCLVLRLSWKRQKCSYRQSQRYAVSLDNTSDTVQDHLARALLGRAWSSDCPGTDRNAVIDDHRGTPLADNTSDTVQDHLARALLVLGLRLSWNRQKCSYRRSQRYAVSLDNTSDTVQDHLARALLSLAGSSDCPGTDINAVIDDHRGMPLALTILRTQYRITLQGHS